MTEPAAVGWRARGMLAAAVVVIMLAGLAVMAPLRHAGFIGDDWVFIGMSRYIDAPWHFYFDDYSSTYFHRPHGMVLWWLTVRAFDNAPLGHYAVNAALHLGNALLLGWAAARLAGWRTGLVCALLFALHPVGVGTASWLSDRFDLLATMGAFGAIAMLERDLARGRWSVWPLVFWVLAVGSKETGLAAGAWLVLRIVMVHPWTPRRRVATLAALLAIAGGYLALRHSVMVSASAAGLLNDPWAALRDGTLAWWLRLPEAVGGGSVALGLALVVPCAALVAWTLPGTREGRALAVPALAFLCAPAVLQSPVGRYALVDGWMSNPSSMRFYYLGLGALLLLAAAATGRARGAVRSGGAIVLVLAALALAPSGWAMSSRWAEISALARRPAVAAALSALDGAAFTKGCVVHLRGLGADTDLPGFVDPLAKASFPSDHPVHGCVVVGDRALFLALVRANHCADDSWPPLVPRIWEGRPVPVRRMPGFCFAVFADPDPAALAADPRVITLDAAPGP